MQIAGYLKTSLIEWPGKISSVIFTQGCNFRCPFCHNRELVEKQRRKALYQTVRGKAAKFQSFKEEEVLRDLELRKKWVDAVVITGGEPTLQNDLAKFLGKLKEIGFLTMVETNGTRPDALASISNFKFQILNYIAMDLKGDLENYQKFTNIQFPVVKIQESIEIIIKSGVEYEFRTTVVPGLHDLENLKRLAEQIREIRGNMATQQHSNKEKISEAMKLCNSVASPKWFLQQFRPMNTLNPAFTKIKPFTKEEMKSFRKELQKIIPNTFLRGV